MKPCPETCAECTHRDCETTHVTYRPVAGVPLIPEKCSANGLVFVANPKGGGKLYKPLKVNGVVKTVAGQAMKSSCVARVSPWSPGR